ncbi:MAG: hypothetical protein MRY83_08670 [Flavobacteriales bacterium]|nr:hypothetical protein [Flavobacteriales bacterium]
MSGIKDFWCSSGYAVKRVLSFFTIFLIGIVLFIVLRKRLKLNIIGYFLILSVFSSFGISLKIIENFRDRDEFKKNLCDKIQDDGMMCKMNNLNLVEYKFLTKDHNWIPNVPESTEEISIQYFRDDFLGDYDLSITIAVPEKRKIDSSNFPKWNLVGQDSNKFLYNYHQGQS